MEDAAHDVRLCIDDLGPARRIDPVAVGRSASGDPPLLRRPTLAHGSPLPKVVEFDLADGGHEPEGLHVDGVHDGLDAELVGLHDLHEGGGGEHAAAEAVRLPANDGVEPALAGRRSACAGNSGRFLETAPAHLLVPRGRCASPCGRSRPPCRRSARRGRSCPLRPGSYRTRGRRWPPDSVPCSCGVSLDMCCSFCICRSFKKPKKDTPPVESGSASARMPSHHL